jgi:truncated hemoglobin YjbI
MIDFLIAALDGPDHYVGRRLTEAHAHLRLTDDAFDSAASHLLDALEARHIRAELLDSVLERIAPLRYSVVTPL